jgi:hypothetical protein
LVKDPMPGLVYKGKLITEGEKMKYEDKKHPDYRDYENEEEKPEDKKFEPEYYEPATPTTQATNVIGWIIALVLLILAIWLLIIALR